MLRRGRRFFIHLILNIHFVSSLGLLLLKDVYKRQVEGGTMTPQGIQTASQILMEYQDLMKNLGFDQPHEIGRAHV